MTETWPTSPDELRQVYESLVSELGKHRAMPEMSRRYGVPKRTVQNRIVAAGLHTVRRRPQRPAPDELRAEHELACARFGAPAAVAAMARAHEVDYATVWRWMNEAGLRTIKPRVPARPVTGPCPCGAPAFSRYRDQDPPLCTRCYARQYSTDRETPMRRSGRLAAIAAKTGRPCTDCGGVFHQAAMEFDHVPERGPKLFNLGQADRSVKAVEIEMAKCDIVCANCHRIRTWNRNHGQAEQPAS